MYVPGALDALSAPALRCYAGQARSLISPRHRHAPCARKAAIRSCTVRRLATSAPEGLFVRKALQRLSHGEGTHPAAPSPQSRLMNGRNAHERVVSPLFAVPLAQIAMVVQASSNSRSAAATTASTAEPSTCVAVRMRPRTARPPLGPRIVTLHPLVWASKLMSRWKGGGDCRRRQGTRLSTRPTR